MLTVALMVTLMCQLTQAMEPMVPSLWSNISPDVAVKVLFSYH